MEELPEMVILDLDLYASWTFDQIFSLENWPPVILSATDQPTSPLLTFSENNNNKNNNLIDGDEEPATLTSFGAALGLIAS